MNEKSKYVITGAFGYTGKYITKQLLERDPDAKIKVLTGHPERPNPFGRPFEIVPFHFDQPEKLVEDLQGVKTVFNTYWVRFDYGTTTFRQAVSNVQNLIRAAAKAGVERFVHISVTNPHIDRPLPYFNGKSIMEKTLIESGLSYAIIRPTLIFGREDVLVHNIAWLLRKFPLYVVFGDGQYRVQPVFVEDVAKLALEASGKQENIIVDATGPETYTFTDLVRLLRKRVGSNSKIVHAGQRTAMALSKVLNLALRDIIITKEEILGLMADTLVTYGPPTCETSFNQWTKENAEILGARYMNELNRHYRSETAKEQLIPEYSFRSEAPITN